MSRQHEATKRQKLLNADGNIAEPGYAKTLIWDYAREEIKAKSIRIKEWDYYIITNQSYALALTLGDNGFAGAISASILDYENSWEITNTVINLFPMGKMQFPSTSVKGDVMWRQKNVWSEFLNDGEKRILKGEFPNFDKKGNMLTYEIELFDTPQESMVIATPFDKPKHFYYNQKINCMRAKGKFEFDGKTYVFDPADSLGTLDWGRGVWTYDNTWYWGSLQAVLPSGDLFGFNIGYGFGNTEAATENMLFWNGKAHKLDEVTFNIPKKDGKDDFMAPWTFTSNDGRFEMNFEPIIDRYAPLDIKVIMMIPHQVFGKFTGKAVLDDGTVVELKDVIGFAEKVHNKW